MQPSFIRNHLVFKTWLLIVYVYCMCFNTWRMQDTSSDNIALLLNSEIACRFYTSVGQITNNYWTKYCDLSVASRSIIRLWQIIDLQDYIAITEFNNCFITGSLSLFFNEYPLEVKCSTTFMQGQSQEGEKFSFILIHVSRILFAAQHSWTTLHMSMRLLFVGSYLQVMWWPLGR